VFGVGIITGDGVNKGRKDTDKEVMTIVDYKELKHTAYLPYEIMVEGNKAYALRARFRIAVYFPDTSMAGKHGFTKIMSSPRGIKYALEVVAGYRTLDVATGKK
jgi:hydrogenase maturation factor HypF (carbamoyltransferase family)